MKSHSRITTVFAAALTMFFATDVFAGRGAEAGKGLGPKQGHRAGKSHRSERGSRAERGERFGRGGPERMAARHAGHLAILELLLSETAPAGFTVENFPDADTDKDGALSVTEWQSFAADRKAKIADRMLEREASIDTDASGELDDAELAAFVEARRAEMLAKLLERSPDVDVDGDGAVSDAEVDAFESPRLERMLERVPEADVNGDGVLDRGEFAMHMLIQSADGERGGPDGIHKRLRDRREDGSCEGKGGKGKSTD